MSKLLQLSSYCIFNLKNIIQLFEGPMIIYVLVQVNMIGVHYQDHHVATGFVNHLAIPILRDEWKDDMSFKDGVRLLEKCIRVLIYRDRSAINKLQVCLHKSTYSGIL